MKRPDVHDADRRTTWQDLWIQSFDVPPVDPTSREVSVQEVLASLIAGRKCAWFEPYAPTELGRAFLQALWTSAFGDAGSIEWFVSEYALPVPLEWRSEIRYTYRCPDLACGADDRVLIVELKTERGSYDARQVVDYLRLARHKLPASAIDVALLAPWRPGASPSHDQRQRYGELTWWDLPPILADVFGDLPAAESLATFLGVDLAPASPSPGHERASTPRSPGHTDRVVAAVAHAVRLAPSVATSRVGDRTERGIDVAFESATEAQAAKPTITEALNDAGYRDAVSVWLWQPASTGHPTTESGHRTGYELRLAPKRSR